MAIKKTPRLHLEIQKSGSSCYGLIRSSFRHEGKVRHKNHGRLTGLNLQGLIAIQAALRGDALIVQTGPDAAQVIESKEYGACHAILQLAKQLGLDSIIYSRPSEQWVKNSFAMIVGRLVYAGSKLSLSHRWKDTALWELCAIEGGVDVDEHCYADMDRLLERQGSIQKTLAARHLGRGSLVLYDITSSYFEGAYEHSSIVEFGYNRDGKRGHEQMVIGLLCSEQGCPVAVEVFAGNTRDAQTVQDTIQQVQSSYGIKEIIFVGDRGMIPCANSEKLKDTKGLSTISPLTHREIVGLLRRNVIQPGLFDDQSILEVIDPEDITKRYCLCRNPDQTARETGTRQALIEATRRQLDLMANSKRKASNNRIAARVGKVLAKTGMGKFVEWKTEAGRLQWSFNEEKIAAEQLLDGWYIITSTV